MKEPKPMTPNPSNAPDLGQPTAAENARAEEMRREERDERMAHRDSSVYAARGEHERVFSNEDWDRAMEPTDPELRRLIQETFDDAILPKLPQRPDWHRLWGSTVHISDTPERRQKVGYRLCKLEDLMREGWNPEAVNIKDAPSHMAGYVTHREMIALECPTELYHRIMREFHHDAPMEQARGIFEKLEEAGEPVTRGGGRITMSPGMENLKSYHRPPRQFE